MDLSAFREDVKTIDAVEHRFAIIGEAASQLPKHITDAHREIPWRIMRDMRNVVVHAYFGVKTDVLWGTIHSDLPPLVPLLQDLLRVGG
jgi:uncharacterized protein with HEPN domain